MTPTSEIETSPVRLWVVSRYKSPGVCTCVDPVKLRAGSRSAQLTAGERHSVEPVYLPTGPLFEQWLHPGAISHLHTAPGKGILIPATPFHGVGIASVARNQGELCEATVHWEE